MSVDLDLETIQTLVSPAGKNDPLVCALYMSQYYTTLMSLDQLHRQLLADAPQLAKDSGFVQAFEVLSTLPASVQKNVLGYPATLFWIDVAWDLIRRQSHIAFPEQHIHMHLEEFGRIVLAATLEGGTGDLFFTVWADAEGRVMLPGTGMYLQTPGQMTYQRLKMRICNGTITAKTLVGDQEISVELTRHHIPALKNGIELNAVDSSLQLPGRTSSRYAQLEPEAVDTWQIVLEEAWTWITQSSPLLAEEIVMGIQALVPVHSDSVSVHLSGSYREAPGLVTLSWTPEIFVLAEALVHEYHHQKLNALLNIDPLIVGPSCEAIYYSPWRKDARPLTGLLHAAYTFQAILEFYNCLFTSGIPLPDENRAHCRAYEIGRQIQTALDSLQTDAQFSPLGKAFLEAMVENLKKQRMQAPEIDALSMQHINTSQAEHRKQWETQHATLLQRSVPAYGMATGTSRFVTGGDEVHAKLEQRALAWLHLQPDFDPGTFLGLWYPSDPLLSATRVAYYERGLEGIRAILNEATPGRSLLLDLLGGHVAYILDEYASAATLYKACIMHNSITPYFWQCYAFALRHLRCWQDSELILTNQLRLIQDQRTVVSNSDGMTDPVEARLAYVRCNDSPQATSGHAKAASLQSSPGPGQREGLLAQLLQQSHFKSFLDIAPTGIQLPSFIATVYGLKPAMDLWIPQYGWEAFQELLVHFGLHYHVDTYFDHHSDQLKAIPSDQFTTTHAALSKTFAEQTEAHVFIARNRVDLDAAVGAGWYPLVIDGHVINKHMADHDKFGSALGYPACCQTFFRQRNNWHVDNTYYAAYRNTSATPHALSNSLMRQTAFSLAPHMTCSFACSATMNYAAQLRAIIADESPAYAQEIDRRLASPIFCLSELRIYRFEGKISSPFHVEYSAVESLYAPHDTDPVYHLLTRGDTCVVEGNVTRVYRKGHQINTYVARADRHGPEFPFLLQCGW